MGGHVGKCYSYYGAGKLVFIDKIMNTAAYVDLLENNLIAFVDRMSLKEFILQQDNDPKHTSKLEKVDLIKKT